MPWRDVTGCGFKQAGFGGYVFLTRGWALRPPPGNQLPGIYIILFPEALC